MASLTEIGGVGGEIVNLVGLIFGNMIVILLEGLLVFINSLRLHFYEFFFKFYQGSGIGYFPFYLDNNFSIINFRTITERDIISEEIEKESKKLKESAQKESSEIIAKAYGEAAEITAKAQKEAEQVVVEARERGKREAEKESARIIAEARQEVEPVRAVIELAEELGMSVIAEGVETAEQLTRLKQLECNAAQGYFFSPPVDGAAITRWSAQPSSSGRSWTISTPSTSLGIRVRRSARTCIPKARARVATPRAIPPNPTRPRLRP